MPKITEIVKSRTVRVNLGDYQSTDFFVSMKAEPAEGEKTGEVANKLRELVDRVMLGDLLAHFRMRGKPIEPAKICKTYGLIQPKKDS